MMYIVLMDLWVLFHIWMPATVFLSKRLGIKRKWFGQFFLVLAYPVLGFYSGHEVVRMIRHPSFWEGIALAITLTIFYFDVDHHSRLWRMSKMPAPQPGTLRYDTNRPGKRMVDFIWGVVLITLFPDGIVTVLMSVGWILMSCGDWVLCCPEPPGFKKWFSLPKFELPTLAPAPQGA